MTTDVLSLADVCDVRRALIDDARRDATRERDRIGRELVDRWGWARTIPAAGEDGYEEWRLFAGDAGLTRRDGTGLRQVMLPTPSGPGEAFFRARRPGQVGAGWVDVDRDALDELAALLRHYDDCRSMLADTRALSRDAIASGDYHVPDWLVPDRWAADMLAGTASNVGGLASVEPPEPRIALSSPPVLTKALADYLGRLLCPAKRAYATELVAWLQGRSERPMAPTRPWADDVVRRVARYLAMED